MKSLSFRQKLWLPIALCWVALLAVTVINAFQARAEQLDARKQTLADVTEMAYTIVADYAHRAETGEFSTDEAKKQAIARVHVQRYAGSGYLTIVQSNSVVVDNPLSPKVNGKDMSDFKDAKGNALYRDIAAAGGSPAGSGFVSYWWPKPGETDPSEKISFVKRFVPWGWDFVAGSYMDDIQAQFFSSIERSLVMILVVGVFVSFVASRVVRNVQCSVGGEPSIAAEAAAQIASGNLQAPILLLPNDTASLMYSLLDMRNQLAVAVARIKVSAQTIKVASKEIASGNLNLSGRTEQQAAALQQTAASMDQLTKTVGQNTESAIVAARLADDASAIAGRGGKVVTDVVTKMAGITQSSNEISAIISVIEGIAFQTNILALNAAVEAARAGEGGRGFAVVASEVRSLAQRSATAAKEIKVLIEGSVSQVDEGSRLVEHAGKTMTEIVGSVERVTSIMKEMSAASKEQSLGIEEINIAIRQMDEVTQHNAALVEEASAAASSLDHEAERLREVVSAFSVDAHMLGA